MTQVYVPSISHVVNVLLRFEMLWEHPMMDGSQFL
jgi:hypothetical protein